MESLYININVIKLEVENVERTVGELYLELTGARPTLFNFHKNSIEKTLHLENNGEGRWNSLPQSKLTIREANIALNFLLSRF